ncbi:MAG: ATPase, partial [Pseudonocardiaceae bacterium]
ECELHIDVCEPPQRLAVSMADEAGTWRMELLLCEMDGSTELRLVHHLDTEDGIGEVGPGWEYYLDMLVAARHGSPTPDFDDYYPAMKSYFDELSLSD